MQTRLLKLRLRRRLRGSQQQVEDIGSQAEAHIDKHLFRRFEHLYPVRRFIIGWVGLVLLLIIAVVAQDITLSGYYQDLKTVPGGIYSEGLFGTFTNANPIYASTDADSTVSKLLFAGLLKSDDHGKLVSSLAKSYSVDSRGTTYTLHLKPNLKWQDGQPLTSKDVVFTFHTIQNPDAQSPLFSSWQGITITALDNQTVEFKLPGILASFPYSLATGIIPEHILASVPLSDLRSSNFNTDKPVGAGPFMWDGLQVTNGNDLQNKQIQIALKPFSGYEGGKPKLDKFIVEVFANTNQLVTSFANKELTAMEAVTPPSKSVTNKAGVVSHNLLLRAANMVFFKTSSGVLADSSVRQALVDGSNTAQIINQLGYPTHQVNEPLLRGQLAYSAAYAQHSMDLKAANQLLDSDGWTTIKGGTRYKANQPLTFSLTAANTPENQMVVSELKKDWQKIGVRLNTRMLAPADFQTSLSYHDYDSVLTAISVGIDPDVFVYWDSSQADIRSNNRLNLSEYKNATADTSLESGRTRLDPQIRIIKYKPFLQAWQQDNPALGLYQPRLLYLTNGIVGGLSDHALTSSTDRFSNVQNWEINEARVSR